MGKCKRLVALLLLFCSVMPLLLTSCNRKYDEAEVLAAARELLPIAEKLNTVYYGEGIRYLSGGISEGAYAEADPEHLSYLGFSSLSELDELTRSVFTISFSLALLRERVGELRVDGILIKPSRYFQKYEDEARTKEKCIMVYNAIEPIFDDRMVIDYSTLRVLGSKRKYVNLAVEVKVTNEYGQVQKKTMTVSLLEESDGWRIDNPVFQNYT